MNKIKRNDIIYLGIKDNGMNFDCAFCVLDAEKTNTGEEEMFLLSENLITNKKGKESFSKRQRNHITTHIQIVMLENGVKISTKNIFTKLKRGLSSRQISLMKLMLRFITGILFATRQKKRMSFCQSREHFRK